VGFVLDASTTVAWALDESNRWAARAWARMKDGPALVPTLARRHRLTVYDAAYLELASRAALPLATLDAMLVAAARSEGVRRIGDAADDLVR
jgi:predicted nucleic acid-binding protein